MKNKNKQINGEKQLGKEYYKIKVRETKNRRKLKSKWMKIFTMIVGSQKG